MNRTKDILEKLDELIPNPRCELEYTKPYEFEGKKVPDVLLSGDHKKIAHWRKKMALYETLAYRKDLLKDHQYTDEEIKLLKELQDEINNR